MSRKTWTEEEENELASAQKQKAFNSWTEIADHLNKKFPNKFRNAKQCRHRFHYYTEKKFQPSSLPWTVEQTKQLLTLFEHFGSKWALIAKKMPMRSQNSLKNKFYGLIGKTLRKINKNEKREVNIKLKTIKSIIKNKIDIHDSREEVWNETQNLRKQIIDLVHKVSENLELEKQVKEIKEKVHKFNKNFRPQIMRKGKVRGKISKAKTKKKEQFNQNINENEEEKPMRQENENELREISDFSEHDFKNVIRELSQKNRPQKSENQNLMKEVCEIFNQNYQPGNGSLFDFS